VKADSRSRARAWLAPGLYACIILTITSVPGEQLALVEDMGVSDRWAHVLLYGPLAMLVFGALGRTRPDVSPIWRALTAVLLCTAFGALDELHQLLIPGRFCDAGDVLADGIGATLGAGMSLVVHNARQRRSRHQKAAQV
jgi:VanZ family protein